MSSQEKQEELILKYIQDRLTVEEKKELFQLTLADPDFRQKLKEELELTKSMKDTGLTLDQKAKDKIYSNIRLKTAKKKLAEEKVENVIMDWLFNLSIPKIVLPIFNFIKRR